MTTVVFWERNFLLLSATIFSISCVSHKYVNELTYFLLGSNMSLNDILGTSLYSLTFVSSLILENFQLICFETEYFLLTLNAT